MTDNNSKRNNNNNDNNINNMKNRYNHRIDYPVISLTTSVTRERLRREILALRKDYDDDTTYTSHNKDAEEECIEELFPTDLESELQSLQEILPQQIEITGLELLMRSDSQYDTEDYSYDSSVLNSLGLAHTRLENKPGRKYSDASSSRSSPLLSHHHRHHHQNQIPSSLENSASSGLDYPNEHVAVGVGRTESWKRYRSHEGRRPSLGYVGTNHGPNHTKAGFLLLPKTYRRLSVFSDHTNETDGDDTNNPNPPPPPTSQTEDNVDPVEYDYGYNTEQPTMNDWNIALSTPPAIASEEYGRPTYTTTRRMSLSNYSEYASDSIDMNVSDYANDSIGFGGRKKQQQIQRTNNSPSSSKSSTITTSFQNHHDMKRRMSWCAGSVNSFSAEILEQQTINTGGASRAA